MAVFVDPIVSSFVATCLGCCKSVVQLILDYQICCNEFPATKIRSRVTIRNRSEMQMAETGLSPSLSHIMAQLICVCSFKPHERARDFRRLRQLTGLVSGSKEGLDESSVF